MKLCPIVDDVVIYSLCKFQEEICIFEFFAIFLVTYRLTWKYMAETPFVSKLKTYAKSMTTNHPRDFTFNIVKANFVLY